MLIADRAHDAITEQLAIELAQVERLFVDELRSDLDCVNDLARHVERYRGKMLRPTLVLVSAMAAHPVDGIHQHHRVIAAVVEMVHMATLVHDDVLDEADVRRSGLTVNHLRGNEAAVMLGDYLISHAYHLCSQLDRPDISRYIAETTNTVCEGELLQLANRNNWSLDEQTYFQIIRRKTASLCGACCRLGAIIGDGDEAVAKQMHEYGEKVGTAFQIVDDLLDLTGSEDTVGKSLGRDLYKGKLTLPLIHLLAASGGSGRTQRLEQMRSLVGKSNGDVDAEVIDALRTAVDSAGGLDYARQAAADLVTEAKAVAGSLPDSPARALLLDMADAVINRQR